MSIHFPQLKIYLVGDTRSGKSSLMKRFCENTFTNFHLIKNQIEFGQKTLQIDESTIELQILDYTGQERFKPYTVEYFAEADAFFIIFDKSDRKSFENLDYWIGLVKGHSVDVVTLMLVGTKCDLICAVSFEEAQEKALQNQAIYIDVSSKTGERVNFLFEVALRQVIYRKCGLR